MTCSRIFRLLTNSAYKAAFQATAGAAACVIGGAIFEENLIDCLILGAIIGGINGAADGFFDQLKCETGTVTQEAKLETNPEVEKISSLVSLAEFGTPALAWFILSEAKNTDINIGFTFATYWTGAGILAGGGLLLFCCCAAAAPASILLAKILSGFLSDRSALYLLKSMQSSQMLSRITEEVEQNVGQQHAIDMNDMSMPGSPMDMMMPTVLFNHAAPSRTLTTTTIAPSGAIITNSRGPNSSSFTYNFSSNNANSNMNAALSELGNNPELRQMMNLNRTMMRSFNGGF